MKSPLFKFLLLALGFALVLLVGWALAARSNTEEAGSRLQVSASFYPMAEFTRQIGGERIAVTTLVGPGVEPHDYDPTPKEMSRMYKSKLLVYNSGELETWIDKIKGDLQGNGVRVVEATRGITLDTTGQDNHGSVDPHVWLDPILAVQQVNTIKSELIAVDPAGRSIYEANASAYVAELQALNEAFRSGLASCELHIIVTSHEAFGYLAKRYGLETISLAGLSPDDEPTPGELAEAATFAKENGLTHIFFETLASPKLAQTIADEVGAEILVLNPLEGLTEQETQEGKDYVQVQKENLQALRTALHCK